MNFYRIKPSPVCDSVYDKWLIMVISKIAHWALFCARTNCSLQEVPSDLTQVIMLRFHFPTEVLQKSYGHMLK